MITGSNNSKSYLAPDYDDEDDDIEDFDEDIDEDGEDEMAENFLDNQEKLKEESRKNIMQTSNSFGSQPSFGQGQSNVWGNNSGTSQVSSPWAQPSNNSSPWGGNNTWNKPSWSWGNNNSSSSWSTSGERKEIDRTKRVIVCDVLDCLVETLQSNGKPGLLPRGIFDIRLRFEVWDKIACFSPDKIFAMVPRTLLNSSNGSESWRVMLEYIVCSLSEYLRSPYQVCQILLQTEIGQPKEDVLLQVLGNIQKESIVMLGVNSGLYGQNNRDQVAALKCGIDYIDLSTFMNSYV